MKVLVIADLHLHNYRTYNKDNFRLNQFIRLAELVRDSATTHGCTEVWIAGDLLMTPKPSPTVMHYLKRFCTIITDSGLLIRGISGNHDLTIKSTDTGINQYHTSTMITLLHNGSNIIFYDDEVVNIDGKSVYFTSWRPQNKISYKDSDILVCHGDIDSRLSPFVDNLIDISKYRFTISGHIHVPLDTDSFCSPGAPIAHSFNDNPNTRLVIFNTDDFSIESISTKDQFLQFIKADDKDHKDELQDKYNKLGKDVFIRIKTRKESSGITQDEIKDINLESLEIDPRSILSTFKDKLKLDKSRLILDEVISTTSSGEDELSIPNLDFKMIKLKANNFLSIRSIDLDFTKFEDKLISISGPNGSGKSTLFKLILFMFYGSLRGYVKSDYTSVRDGSFSGELVLDYNKSRYVITRGLSHLKVVKDGKIIDSNNKRDLQSTLESELQFLSFSSLFYISQESRGIFASMNDSSRITLLSRLIGLSLVKSWTNSLGSKIKMIESDRNKKIDELNKIKGKIEFIQKSIEDLGDPEFVDPTELDSSLDVKTKELDELIGIKNCQTIDLRIITKKITDAKNLRDRHTSQIKRIDELTSKIDSLRLSYNEKLKIFEDYKSIHTSLGINTPEEVESLYKSINSELTTSRSEYRTIKDRLGWITDKTNELKSVYTSYVENPNRCPKCNQEWKSDDYELEVSESYKRYKDSESVRLELSDKLESIKVLGIKLRDKLSGLEDIMNLVSELLRDKESLEFSETRLLKFKVDSNIGSGLLTDSELDKLTQDRESISSSLSSTDSRVKSIESEVGNLRSTICTINRTNEKWERKVKLESLISDELSKELVGLESSISEDESIIDELNKFNSKILSDKGLLVAALLSKVAEYLNTDEYLKVETTEVLQNGTIKPSLNIKYYIEDYDRYLDYNSLSGGQRMSADLRFMNCITNNLCRIGFIMMDESFKFFSDEVIHESAEMINEFNVGQVMLVIHGVDPSGFTKSMITTSMDDGSRYRVI